jgi:hypothetical protein
LKRHNFKITHVEANTHELIELQEPFITSVLMPSPPRKNNEEEHELYAQIILTLFKPWTTFQEINNLSDWSESLKSFLDCARTLKLIENVENLKKSQDDAIEEKQAMNSNKKIKPSAFYYLNVEDETIEDLQQAEEFQDLLTDTLENYQLDIVNPKHQAMDPWCHSAITIISKISNTTMAQCNNFTSLINDTAKNLLNNVSTWKKQYDAVHDDNIMINLSETNLFADTNISETISTIIHQSIEENIPTIDTVTVADNLQSEVVNTELITANFVASHFSLNLLQSLVFKLVIESLFVCSILQVTSNRSDYFLFYRKQ